MRPVALLVLGLAGCGAAPPLPAPPVPPAPPVVAAATVPPGPVLQIDQAFAAAARQEPAAITAATATPAFIDRVHAADVEARRELGRLERQGRHYTVEALQLARDAVNVLATVLRADPAAAGDHGGSP